MADLSPDRKPVFLAVAAQAATLAAEKLAARVKELEGRVCGTCKFWQEPGEHRSHGACYRIDERAHEPGAKPLKSAQACLDSFDEDASLETLSTFGCTLHEVKT